MSLKGSRIGVIGGSIAGCAAAAALMRAGCKVEIFERSSKGLRDRGSGIGIPKPLRQELMEKAYLPKDFPSCEMKQRYWMFPDGSRDGRNLWTQATPAFANNWGNLWSALRGLVPDEIYHEGKQLAGFAENRDGVRVDFADGTSDEFDLVVGADGYNSKVRTALHPGSAPEYAGYVLWRGNFPETRVQDRRLIDILDKDTAWLTMPFPGGHGVCYLIPNFDGSDTPGQRRVNWAVYAPCPKSQTLDGVESIAPGSVSEEVFAEFQNLLETHFPPSSRGLLSHTRRDEISIQPIYDSIVDSFVSDRILLIGDAGTIPRPHTASGATKALQEALSLEEIAAHASSLSDLLKRYDEECCASAASICRIGRRIGEAQVLNTPDWGNMSEDDFVDWVKRTLAGEKLYLYGDKA